MANNENVNKVSFNNNVLIDLTGDTVSSGVIVSGYTAHDRSGASIEGSFVPVTGIKGDSESSYRTGDVNLTPANIGAKATQSAVSSPTASGTAVAFIDTISQDVQGAITATKKTVQNASTSANGLMSSNDKTKLDSEKFENMNMNI